MPEKKRLTKTRMVAMSVYVLNFEMVLYGPYYSRRQAQFAHSLFSTKYPSQATECAICKIDLNASREKILDPR